MPRLKLYSMKGVEIPIMTQIPRDIIFKLRNFVHMIDNLSTPEAEKRNNKLWSSTSNWLCVKAMYVFTRVERNVHWWKNDIIYRYHKFVTIHKKYDKPCGIEKWRIGNSFGLSFRFFLYQGGNTPDGASDKKTGFWGSVVKKLYQSLSGTYSLLWLLQWER